MVRASQLPQFLPALARAQSVRYFDPANILDPDDILSSRYMPWTIPSVTDIEALRRLVKGRPESYGYWDRKVYRVSAAALAIHFLDSLSSDARLQVRNITLLEDRLAIAFPECHARGLIPLAKENPQLRIERCVNLWRNAFQLPCTDRHLGYRQVQVPSYIPEHLKAVEVSRLIAP
jgi:hypothetical protein